jgi:hypothetical protein
MKSRQLSARSNGGRRDARSCAAVGQAGATTTATPSIEAARYLRQRARHVPTCGAPAATPATDAELLGDTIMGCERIVDGGRMLSIRTTFWNRTPRCAGVAAFLRASATMEMMGGVPLWWPARRQPSSAPLG